MKILSAIAVVFLFPVFALAQAQRQSQPMDTTIIEEGRYLVRLAGCTDCHSARSDEEWAGGVPINVPFAGIQEYATFFSPNISPDKATGIGSWSEAEFRQALRDGKSPMGTRYLPVFPYTSFTKMTDEDIHKIYVFLQNELPIYKKNLAPRDTFPLNKQWPLWVWQNVFWGTNSSSSDERMRLGYGPFQKVSYRSESWNRGAYLVEAFFHCTQCHTPRNTAGDLISTEWMAGSNLIFDKKWSPPNITPDKEFGLGDWSANDWSRFLASGQKPGHPNSTPQSEEMLQVIQGTVALTKSDREAVVEYLMSLKPVRKANNVITRNNGGDGSL